MDVSNKILGSIAIVIVVIALLALTPLVVNTVEYSLGSSEPHAVTGESAFNGTGGATYSGTLRYYNIDPLSVTIGNTTYSVTDNGVGVLDGGDGTGTIDYSTGAWSITWGFNVKLNDEYVADYNSLGWTFSGGAGAAALLSLVPFVWVASILICAIVGMITLSKSS